MHRRRARRAVAATTLALVLAAGCADDGSPSEAGAGAPASGGHVDLATDRVDPVALDLFAPVSGASVRSGRPLDHAIDRAQWQRESACLEAEGFPGLGDHVASEDRVFAFPDVEDLRRHGFRQSMPAAENAGGPDLQDTPEFLAARDRCGAAAVLGGDLTLDSFSSEISASLERDEERALWRTAAGCLADRGYDERMLDTELTFLGGLTGRFSSIDDPAELLDAELEAAEDYIACASPVWEARTADLEARRERWLEIHRDELIATQAWIQEYLAETPR